MIQFTCQIQQRLLTISANHDAPDDVGQTNQELATAAQKRQVFNSAG